MLVSDETLLKLIKEGEYLSPDEIELSVATAAGDKTTLYDAILEKDLLSDENLGQIVADYLHFPFVTLSRVTISPENLMAIPEEVARINKVIVFEETKDIIKVATCNPEKMELLGHISKKVGRKLEVYYATERDIALKMQLYKKQMQEQFNELLSAQVHEAKTAAAKEAPITKLMNLIIEYAYYQRASDIHIEPREDSSLTRFRIDGVLHDVLILPKELHEQVISRIKVMAKLRTDEHQSAQDGKLRVALDEEHLDIRVSIVPISKGEDAVLRLLSSKSRQFSLSDLGMDSSDLAKVKNGYEKPYGMVLVTGPTGSGKTTSVYSIIKILNSREKNVATIEDPIEYEIKGINQIQVNTKTNLTFASGLRSILRQDPDIILVGEIRDEETADIAVNSAMTGHLVFSTLHTNDAATAIPRLLDMKIEPFLVASTVNVIIGQRLIRKICSTCRVSFIEKKTNIRSSYELPNIEKYFGSGDNIRLYKGKGCGVCRNTGYIGRVGIFEVLVVEKKIQELITAKASADDIRKKAIELGMTTMLEDGLKKVQQGLTTIEEVLRAAKL